MKLRQIKIQSKPDGTVYLHIPREIAEFFGIKKGDQVTVTADTTVRSITINNLRPAEPIEFPCPYCSYIATYREFLQHHIENKHKSEVITGEIEI